MIRYAVNIPSILLSHNAAFAACLLTRLSSFYYQAIQLEELANHSLPLRVKCQ